MYKFYVDKGSFIHKLHPLAKFTWFICIFLFSAIFNVAEFTVLMLVWALIYVGLSRLPLKKFSRIGLLAVWIITISVVLWPMFIKGGRVIFTWYVFFFTDVGVSVGLAFGLKVISLIISVFAWLMTTSQKELIGMFYDLRIPPHYVFGIALTFRFMPTLAGEYGRVREAQKSRAFSVNRGSITRRIKAFALLLRSVIIPMINRVLKTVNDLSLCLSAKGLDFSKPRPKRKINLEKSDKIFIIVNILVILGFAIVRLMGYGYIPM